MTTQRQPNLVANLRALDEQFGHLEPNPSFERRLQKRLQSAVAKKTSSPWTNIWLRKYARLMAVAIAACTVLLLSISEKAPPEQPVVVLPNAPDAAVDPIQSPMGERLEQAIPHRDEMPKTPLTSSPESPAPTPQDLRHENPSVFPEQPENESTPEKRFIDGMNGPPAPFSNPRQDGTRNRSDAFGFWSPAQALPIDAPLLSDGKLGEWSGGGLSQPKTSRAPLPPSSSSVCLAAEQWKKQAILDCEENGQVLTNIVYLDPCKDGSFRRAEHECAENPADEETCTTDTITNGNVCVDPGELKMLAYEQCKLAMKDLVDFTYVADDCGWKTRKAKYTCCPFPQEPPPPGPAPVCQGEVVGDGATCKDLGAIKEDAFLLCNNLGQTLTDIQPFGNCPNGQASMAKVMCCGK